MKNKILFIISIILLLIGIYVYIPEKNTDKNYIKALDIIEERIGINRKKLKLEEKTNEYEYIICNDNENTKTCYNVNIQTENYVITQKIEAN